MKTYITLTYNNRTYVYDYDNIEEKNDFNALMYYCLAKKYDYQVNFKESELK